MGVPGGLGPSHCICGSVGPGGAETANPLSSNAVRSVAMGRLIGVPGCGLRSMFADVRELSTEQPWDAAGLIHPLCIPKGRRV